jgi:hypothetical protein
MDTSSWQNFVANQVSLSPNFSTVRIPGWRVPCFRFAAETLAPAGLRRYFPSPPASSGMLPSVCEPSRPLLV